MAFVDYYSVLKVLPQATQKEITAAYKALALQWHPDRNKGVDTTEQMKLINEAYGVLKSPKKRQEYNVQYYQYHQAGAYSQPKAAYTSSSIVRCYYCGKNIANPMFAHQQTFYKRESTGHSPFGRVWYRSVEVEIPRCEACYKVHYSGAKVFMILPIVAFTLLGLILGLALWSAWVAGLMCGAVVGFILGKILSAIDNSIVAKEAGVKAEDDIDEFETVRDLNRNGWSVNRPN